MGSSPAGSKVFSGLKPRPFLEAQKKKLLSVPMHPVPYPFGIPVHDFERRNRSLMPVLDLAQDVLDVVGDRLVPEIEIGDGDNI